MSTTFENGVQKYVRGYAVVETAFPVDNKGVTYAACKYCRFFSRRSGRCNLTDEIILYNKT